MVMGQIIDLDQWRHRSVQPMAPPSAGIGLPDWQAFPPTLVDTFVLTPLALWRSCVVACAGWWLAPLGFVIGPVETSQPARTRARQSFKS